MKKTFTLFNLVALLSLCMVFTACEPDPDTEESMVLSGQWRGDWGMYYVYQYPRSGREETYKSYDTDIVFYPDYDYATHGYGYQVDWYAEGPYERLSFRFTWSIVNGVVNVQYPGYPEYDTFIRDYHLDNDRFTGYLGDSAWMFSLGKIADYYDWSYYYSYGDYHYWNNSAWSYDYYAKTRGTAESDSTAVDDASEGRIIRVGSKYAK